MTALTGISHVVIDIEGTTSSTWFVYEHLYPYSRERFAEYVARRDSDDDVARAVGQVAELLGRQGLTDEEVVTALNAWLDEDRKVTPLKTIQGLIWDDGFARGQLTSHFYPDVIPAIRSWHAAGIRIAVFSSGSLKAQSAWFGHSPEGDLRPLLAAAFDTESAGPKRSAASYATIAASLDASPSSLLFLSDLDDELDAATHAGWHAVGVSRPGEQHHERGVGDHALIGTFDELELSP
ncbi:MAG: acireductone synthase [Candidatus Nanopelagicales bacterium]